METILRRKREREIEKTDVTTSQDVELNNNLDNIDQLLYNSNIHWNLIKNEDLTNIMHDKKFTYGNYNKFYYKRFLEALKDTRLQILKQEWFKDKDCLDIGCNDGTLTIMIALEYQPKIIEGIDIDYSLIKLAIKNMKYVMRKNLSQEFVNNLIIADKKGNNIVEQILDKDDLQSDYLEKIKVYIIYIG